jgi:exopolyphosphatase / guanosine-5'-triphosphate,3'-diphosphate pyrophosphatase
MRIASIDIGTNTILLLVAEIDKNGITKIIRDDQVIARLGKGVDAEKIINQETFLRAEYFLMNYKKTCDLLKVEKILAVGTSALRDARNNIDFCGYIYNKTGIHIEIISGDEEARWTYRGGTTDFSDLSEYFCVIDIGGGSTEVIVGNKEEIISKASFDIGSVRITERFLHDSPPTPASIREATQFTNELISPHIQTTRLPAYAIGVAGTVTTLAALDLNLAQFDAQSINGHILSKQFVNTIFEDFKNKSVEEINMFPQISFGRADIILAGIMILDCCLEVLKFEKITVSVKGLRYGILLREIKNLFH